MFHICSDEIIAFLMLFPFIGYYFARLKEYFHSKFGSKCPNHHCESEKCKNEEV